jgi:hypothetical protein
MAQADIPGALARRGENHFRSGGVGIFFEKVVLDLEDICKAELIGEPDLLQGFLHKAIFIVRMPLLAVQGLRQLQVVKQAESHLNSPLTRRSDYLRGAIPCRPKRLPYLC